MMRLLTPRISFAFVAALFASAMLASPSSAAPAQQTDLTILAVGFVDVAGGSDPSCPACNGEYDDEDEDYAMNNPLGEMEFVVRDDGGTEVDRQTTTPLAGFQRVTFTVPELNPGESYTLELVNPPSSWLLCFNEAASRTLSFDDFQLGSAREDYRFYQSSVCDNGGGSPTATSVPPVNTATPGPSPTRDPNAPTSTPRPEPTDKPDSGGDDDDDDDDKPIADDEADRDLFATIEGIAFIDHDENGMYGAGEPGLNDVLVRLHGGGLELEFLTGPTGVYSFGTLRPGTYDVFIAPGGEWKVTTPHKYTVTVNDGINRGYDFGLIRWTDAGTQHPKKDYDRGGKHDYDRADYDRDHDGIRLPSTGIADVPTAGMLGSLALLLGALAVFGYGAERRRRDR